MKLKLNAIRQQERMADEYTILAWAIIGRRNCHLNNCLNLPAPFARDIKPLIDELHTNHELCREMFHKSGRSN